MPFDNPSQYCDPARTLVRAERRARVSFWIIAAAFFTVVAATSIPTALYPLYRSAYGLHQSASALVFAIYAFTLVPAMLVFGPLSDRYGRRRVIVTALVLSLAATVVACTETGFTGLLVVRVLHGCSAGVCTAAASAAMFDYGIGSLPRAIVEASIVAGPTLGSAIGPLWGAYAASLSGHSLVIPYLSFLPVVVLTLIAMAFTRRGHPRSPPLHGDSCAGVVRPVRGRVLRSFLAAGLASFLGWSMIGLFQSLMPGWIRDATQTSRLDLAVAGAVVALLVSMTVQLTARSRPQRLLRQISYCTLVVTCAVFTVTVALPRLWLIVIVAVCTGIAHGTGFLAAVKGINELALDVMPHRHATLLAAYYIGNYLALGLPVLGIGLLADGAGLDTALYGYAAAVGVLAVIALVRMVGGRRHQPG